MKLSYKNIPYTIRKSKRARRVFLRYLPRVGLEIVIPERTKTVNIINLLEKHESWILQQQKLDQVNQKKYQQDESNKNLYLRAIKKQITLKTIQTADKFIRLIFSELEAELVLYGATNNTDLITKSLRVWLKQQANKFFTPKMKNLSDKTDLKYSNLDFRNTKTRWGSCSIDGKISLNYNLIFLPENLVEHIMLHELCHIKHHNHSKNFWKLLSSFDSQYLQHHKQMKTADYYIPKWL